MSRFRKLSHTIWHCQYHIVWVPKYRFRVLVGGIKEATESGIQAICGYTGCEVVELNVQRDHVHLIVMIPPKVSISYLMGEALAEVFNASRWKKSGESFRKGYVVRLSGCDMIRIPTRRKGTANRTASTAVAGVSRCGTT